jgi:hypothetical protein
LAAHTEPAKTDEDGVTIVWNTRSVLAALVHVSMLDAPVGSMAASFAHVGDPTSVHDLSTVFPALQVDPEFST